MIAAGIEALAHPPDGLLAWLGPAIGAGRYEVDGTVRDAFTDSSAEPYRFFSHRRDGVTERMASLIWVRR